MVRNPPTTLRSHTWNCFTKVIRKCYIQFTDVTLYNSNIFLRSSKHHNNDESVKTV